MPQPVKYAGFGLRMLAAVVDVFSTILLLPLFSLFDNIAGTNAIRQQVQDASKHPELHSTQEIMAIFLRLTPSMLFQLVVIGTLILLAWIYFSATPGKMLFKLKIVDAATGGKPSKKQLILRLLGSIISLLVLGLGFVWIHYSKKRQGWHDLMAGTAVVDDKEKIV